MDTDEFQFQISILKFQIEFICVHLIFICGKMDFIRDYAHGIITNGAVASAIRSAS